MYHTVDRIPRVDDHLSCDRLQPFCRLQIGVESNSFNPQGTVLGDPPLEVLLFKPILEVSDGIPAYCSDCLLLGLGIRFPFFVAV